MEGHHNHHFNNNNHYQQQPQQQQQQLPHQLRLNSRPSNELLMAAAAAAAVPPLGKQNTSTNQMLTNSTSLGLIAGGNPSLMMQRGAGSLKPKSPPFPLIPTTTTTTTCTNNNCVQAPPPPHKMVAGHINNQCQLEYAAPVLEWFGRLSANSVQPKFFLDKHQIGSSLRNKMVDWMIEVMSSYGFKDQTLFRSVLLMDSFLANCSSRQPQSALHLLGVGAMFLACKAEEIFPIKARTMHEKIAHGKLSCEQIRAEQSRILQTLGFDTSKPTLLDYVKTAIVVAFEGIITNTTPFNIKGTTSSSGKVCSSSNSSISNLFTVATTIAKMTLFQYELISSFRMSTIAASVVVISLQIVNLINQNKGNHEREKEFELGTTMAVVVRTMKESNDKVRICAVEIAKKLASFAQRYPTAKNLFKTCGEIYQRELENIRIPELKK